MLISVRKFLYILAQPHWLLPKYDPKCNCRRPLTRGITPKNTLRYGEYFTKFKFARLWLQNSSKGMRINVKKNLKALAGYLLINKYIPHQKMFPNCVLRSSPQIQKICPQKNLLEIFLRNLNLWFLYSLIENILKLFWGLDTIRAISHAVSNKLNSSLFLDLLNFEKSRPNWCEFWHNRDIFSKKISQSTKEKILHVNTK